MDDEFCGNLLDHLHDGIYFVDLDRRITYWNLAAERIAGYRSSEVVGKRCRDNLLIHIDDSGATLCDSGSCPLERSIAGGTEEEKEAYLRHRDGHRVPVLIRTFPLRDPKGKTVGAVEIFSDNSSGTAFLHRIEELQKMTILDHLTGLPNRRYIEMNLDARLSEMQRYGWPFGVLFIDIDHFKNINDAYGHATGDDVLRMIAQTFINNSRPFDTIGRWGGEEFVAVILNVQGDVLCGIADRLRMLIEQSSLIAGETTIRVTISIGATLACREDTIETLLQRADRLMYRSKASGRNCVSTDSGA
ncbi:MAG: GGDEF domain-containing protein [Nitrospirae bacterium]|nr:GGDEF domain-containing protein [Nitrospirota bacterium]